MQCCQHQRAAGRLFSRAAKRYRRRFNRKGLEKSQRQLMQGVLSQPLSGAGVLEIGCGVGYFHHLLLSKGAGWAVGVDLAETMVAEARRWAAEKGLADRTTYYCGDYMALYPLIPKTDITVMDKVICCYPDSRSLLERCCEETRQCIALTYPRDRWYMRGGIAVGALLMKTVRSAFRPYFYAPDDVNRWMMQKGFTRSFQAATFFWLTEVYTRQR